MKLNTAWLATEALKEASNSDLGGYKACWIQWNIKDALDSVKKRGSEDRRCRGNNVYERPEIRWAKLQGWKAAKKKYNIK